MLDQEHRDAALFLNVEDEARHVFGFFAVHPGDRFIEHQNLWLHRQRPRQLDALLQAVGQARNRLVADVVNLQKIDHLTFDLAAQFHFFIARGAEIPHRRQRIRLQPPVAAQLDVVEHRHAAKQRDVLKRAREANPGALVRRQLGDVGAFEQHAAARRFVEAGDRVEQAGLAGAVRPDDGGDLTALRCERNVVERANAAEAQLQRINL